MNHSTKLPPSVSNIWVNVTACALFFLSVQLGQTFFVEAQMTQRICLALMVAVLPLIYWDLIVRKNGPRIQSAGSPTQTKTNVSRLLIKLIGFYATMLGLLVTYYFNPLFYHSAKAFNFYAPFLSVLTSIVPASILLSAVYFWYVDKQQEKPNDEYWQFGSLVLGRFKDCQTAVIVEYLKSWFIKAFFLPFMFGFLVSYCQTITSWKMEGPVFLAFFNHSLDFFYAVDVLFGALGYSWTFRFFNTHIQSTEPTILGWWMCLACYFPFYTYVGLGILPPQSDLPWDVWFAFNPVLLYGCGIAILGLTFVYALATVAFGYRMSNLTYRGIITNGPYRFTKHPAYICKVASWWLVSLPFFSTQGPKAACVQCVSMIVISLVYYLRAKTEENHLSNYPEYVQYAEWINEHGMFSWLGKICPAFKYSQNKVKKYNSVVWFKKVGV